MRRDTIEERLFDESTLRNRKNGQKVLPKNPESVLATLEVFFPFPFSTTNPIYGN